MECRLPKSSRCDGICQVGNNNISLMSCFWKSLSHHHSIMRLRLYFIFRLLNQSFLHSFSWSTPSPSGWPQLLFFPLCNHNRNLLSIKTGLIMYHLCGYINEGEKQHPRSPRTKETHLLFPAAEPIPVYDCLVIFFISWTIPAE